MSLSVSVLSLSAPVPVRLPQPCSIRFLVQEFLDIAAVPRRSFFELLATFTDNELEREKLAEFSSAQGQNELHSYCSRPRRTALEVKGSLSGVHYPSELVYMGFRFLNSAYTDWYLQMTGYTDWYLPQICYYKDSSKQRLLVPLF